jgi:hypothetical protein
MNPVKVVGIIAVLVCVGLFSLAEATGWGFLEAVGKFSLYAGLSIAALLAAWHSFTAWLSR